VIAVVAQHVLEHFERKGFGIGAVRPGASLGRGLDQLSAVLALARLFGAGNIVQTAQDADKPQLGGDAQQNALAGQAVFFLAVADLLWQCLEVGLVRGSQAAAQVPAQIGGKVGGAEALVQGADDFGAGGDFGGGLELAEALVAGGDDLGEVLVQRQGGDVVQELDLGAGA